MGIVTFQEYFVEEMFQFLGKTVTVTTSLGFKYDKLISVLHVEGDNLFKWYPEMFERVVD